MTQLDRRQTLLGLAALIGTAALGPSALAQKSATLWLVVERPESLRGL